MKLIALISLALTLSSQVFATDLSGVATSAAYVGRGDWYGSLASQNVQSPQYQQFFLVYANGQMSALVNVRLWTGFKGILPEQMGFAVGQAKMGGDGFLNTAGNGFVIQNYQYNAYYQTGVNGAGTPATAPPALQIVTHFVDVCRNTMNVDVVFQGVTVLSGQVTGNVIYSPGQRFAEKIPAQCFMAPAGGIY